MKEIHDFTIVDTIPEGDNYVRMKLQHGGKMLPVRAGQFAEVRVDGVREVMLRRPISIHDADASEETLTLLVQTVGAGTRRLAALEVGERLNLVYPLGNGFSTELDAGQHALLVGGGAGIAPLLLLARTLASRGVVVDVLLGGRRAGLIACRDSFAPYGTVHTATDDGSLGERGTVVEHSVFGRDFDRIYACGPTPMMKAVARSAARRGIGCEVSLENMMACGVGACLCCVADTDGGHRCVCKDGPVFDIGEMKKWYEQC